MDFDTFYRVAHAAFEAIPEEFREGVDGLTIRPEAVPHPTLHGVFTLGQCVTEAYPSEWTGPETLRSVVALFHGSFRALARADPEFDWEGELWETLTHELRHHLESLAGEDGLDGVDYAMEEAFHRAEGEDFDPLYYRAGVEIGPGLYQVEYDYFLEQSWELEAFEETELIGFSWHGAPKRVARPNELGDIHYVWIKGLEVGPGSLQLVLLRKRKWKDNVRALRGGGVLELWESEAELVP